MLITFSNKSLNRSFFWRAGLNNDLIFDQVAGLATRRCWWARRWRRLTTSPHSTSRTSEENLCQHLNLVRMLARSINLRQSWGDSIERCCFSGDCQIIQGSVPSNKALSVTKTRQRCLPWRHRIIRVGSLKYLSLDALRYLFGHVSWWFNGATTLMLNSCLR